MKRFFSLFLIVSLFAACSKEETSVPEVVQSIALSETTLSLRIDETHQFKIQHSPSHLNSPKYIWQSSSNDILSVNEMGEIKALNIGEAVVTVTTVDKTLSSKCNVTIAPVLTEKISLNESEIELRLGESVKLEFTILPDNTTDKSVVWKSEDESIASVDKEGKIKAISVGETTVKVSTSNALESICKVVVKPTKATEIKLNKSSIALEVTDTEKLTIEFTPSNTTNKNLKWDSSNTSIATVNENGEITAVDEGTCEITAISEDGNFEAICVVSVSVKGLVLTDKSIVMLPGNEILIWVKYLTLDKAYTNATWSSSNPNVAEVTGDGIGTNSALIKSNNYGSAIITATSSDGLKSVSCSVDVKDIQDAVTLVSNPQKASFRSGYTIFTIGCEFTNPVKNSIFINSVFLLSSDDSIIEMTAPDNRNLSNESFQILFNPITIHSTNNYQDIAEILSRYKVVVQYTLDDKYYNKIVNVNPNKFGGYY
jgi:uncharacterized protein YjdB